MKKQLTIPLLSAAGGAAALLLRIWQNRTGFEAGTGLPIPGAPAGTALLALLALLAAALVLLCLRLPKEADPGPALPGDFSRTTPLLTTLQTAGALLIALSGLSDLLEGLGSGSLLLRLQAAADPYGAALAAEAMPLLSQKAQLLAGILALVSGAAVLLATASCRRQEPCKAAPLLLVPPVALVIRLVLAYRINSINPALSAYYVELLALAFLTLGFYRLSSFAFQAGRTRRFALYAAPAVTLSLAALADGGALLSSLLLYAGGALALLGFLTARLLSPPVPVPQPQEEETGGQGDLPAGSPS